MESEELLISFTLFCYKPIFAFYAFCGVLAHKIACSMGEGLMSSFQLVVWEKLKFIYSKIEWFEGKVGNKLAKRSRKEGGRTVTSTRRETRTILAKFQVVKCSDWNKPVRKARVTPPQAPLV